MVGDAEDLHGRCELPDPVLAQRVVAVAGQMGQVGNQHLALLAERAGDERDAGAFGDVARHRQPGLDRLVVGVGMHEQQAAVRVIHGGQPTNPVRHAWSGPARGATGDGPGSRWRHQLVADGSTAALAVTVVFDAVRSSREHRPDTEVG